MLTLICGIPNAGKTTYSQKFGNVIHSDDYHFNSQCSKSASKVNGDVCVEGLYNRASDRKQLIDACHHQSTKVCIWLDTPLGECKDRERLYRRRPLSMVEDFHRIFEPPTYDEGWDEIIIIKGDAEYVIHKTDLGLWRYHHS